MPGVVFGVKTSAGWHLEPGVRGQDEVGVPTEESSRGERVWEVGALDRYSLLGQASAFLPKAAFWKIALEARGMLQRNIFLRDLLHT